MIITMKNSNINSEFSIEGNSRNVTVKISQGDKLIIAQLSGSEAKVLGEALRQAGQNRI